MKNNSVSLPQFGLLPRSISLPPSDIMLRLLFACLLMAVTFTSAAPAQSRYVGRPVLIDSRFAATESRYSIERRVFELVNQERINNGRKPLEWIENAAEAARFHSANMAASSFLGHADLGGKKVHDRADQFGLSDWRRIGENVAWISGYDDPAARVVYCWMNSASHRKNMLDSKFRESGLGLAVTDKGKYYFTQVFVSRK